MQLAVAIWPYKAKTDLSGYTPLCAEIGPSYNQGLAMAAALQGTTVQAMLSQCRGYKECFKCGYINHFTKDCPKIRGIDRQLNCSSGICPHCRRVKMLRLENIYIWVDTKLRAASGKFV